MYSESNRKPGSKSPFFGLPPYFYFLFGLRGSKNVIFGRFLAGLVSWGDIVPKSLLYFVGLMDLFFVFRMVGIYWYSGEIRKFEPGKISHIFRFLGLYSPSFGPGCAIIFRVSPLHKLRPQLPKKYLGQSTSLMTLKIRPIEKKILKF